MIGKTLYREVAEVMEKGRVDEEVIDKTSDILKMLKALDVLNNSISTSMKQWALCMIAKYKQDGTQELYDKVLLGRRSHEC